MEHSRKRIRGGYGGRTFWYKEDMDTTENVFENKGERVENLKDANLISSLIDEEGMHQPIIDIRSGVKVRAVPSTNEDCFHLYIDIDVPEDKYGKLIEAMHECGIIETGILNQWKMRGMTQVRPPHVKKPRDSPSSENIISIHRAKK